VGERTEHAPGTFSWAELATTDPEDAKTFYTSLFGWEAEDQPIPGGGAYTFLKKNGLQVAALHGHLQDDVPPNWTSYVTVEDADSVTEKARELGAIPLAGPFDVMQAGRMAVLQDPQGAIFAVWQPKESIGARLVNDPGAMTMNQLNASSPSVAQDFYSDLFGWRFDQVAEEPPFWGIYNGERLNGGMMPLPAQAGAPSHWLTYFTSSDVDASAGKIGELGGRVLVGPMPVPSGRIAVAADPQGATFGLVEGRMDD
jgi:uncharacterized protein